MATIYGTQIKPTYVKSSVGYDIKPGTEPITSPSNRTVYRHASDLGSVVCFTMYCHAVQLLVYDAMYRSYGSRPGTAGVGITSNKDGSSYVFGSDQGVDTVLTQEDAALDTWLSNGSSMTMANEAAVTTRTAVNGYPFYLPNVYELCIIRIEADYIDSLDPTASSYSGYLLGKACTYSHHYFSFGFYGCLFACTNICISDRLAFYSTSTCGIAPVYELMYN